MALAEKKPGSEALELISEPRRCKRKDEVWNRGGDEFIAKSTERTTEGRE